MITAAGAWIRATPEPAVIDPFAQCPEECSQLVGGAGAGVFLQLWQGARARRG